MGLRGNLETFKKAIEEIAQTLCPGALSTHLCRIDTAENHPHRTLYESDRDYFRITRQRAFIREARCGEFDYSPSSHPISEQYPSLQFQSVPQPNDVLKAVWEHIPRLWVLCVELGQGRHQITTIFRGEPMWKVVDRDGSDVAQFKSEDEFGEVMDKIQACEGLDKAAWERFWQRAWDASVVYAATTENQGSQVH
jgi:hypothetical protein